MLAEVRELARSLPCSGCGAEVRFRLQDGFSGPDVKCQSCGTSITDHAAAVEGAQDRFDLPEAFRLTQGFTYQQIQEIARKAYDDPVSVTPDEMDIIRAFVLCRAHGLPGCKRKEAH